jgi:two-component system sensor histidine kinase BarA
MSLSIKIPALILLALTGLLSLFGWAFISDEERVLQHLLDRQGRALAQAISIFSIEPVLRGDYPVLEAVLHAIGAQTEDVSSITVLRDGASVAEYRRGPEAGGKTFRHDIAHPGAEGGFETQLGEVRLVLSDSRNRELVARRLNAMRVYLAVIFVVLWLALALILRHTVLRRVEQLTDYAEGITTRRANVARSTRALREQDGGGRPGGGGASKTKDEIARLGWSLATMDEAIRGTEALLRQHAQELERKVKVRTRELQISKDKAESSDRAKSVFLANMSHEIRTPMNGVIGFTKLLSETPLDARQQDYVRTISVSAHTLRVIIDDILDYTKLEADRLELERHPFDLDELLDATVSLLTPQANGRGLELVHGIAVGTPVRLLGDPVRIRQVVTNLVDNALKFTARGTVSLWVDRFSDAGRQWLRFEVSDTGMGIDEADLTRLFRPFSQADVSVTRRFGGTGLGLAICKQLVERMGGHIDVQSRMGRGSRFWFTLPLETQPGVFPEADRCPALDGRRALVYAPGNLARRAISHTLMRMGLEVISAGTLERLAALTEDGEAANFDLLLLVLGTGALADRLHRISDRLTGPGRPKVVLLWDPIEAEGADEPEPRAIPELGVPVDLALPNGSGFKALSEALARLVAPPQRCDTVPAVAEPVSSPAPRLGELTVLVVDDNPINLKLTKTLLESGRVRLLTATDGEQAVRLAREQHPDVVLMDIQMPGMSGLEATQRIRAQERGRRRTPVIAVTAHAYPEERQHFLAEGLDDCITKPLDAKGLWRLIERWTGNAAQSPEGGGGGQAIEEPDGVGEQLVYDPEAALRVAGGSQDTADELWNLLLEQLPQHRQCLEDALAGADTEKLREHAHKLHGSAAYCCTPALKAAAAALEKAASAGEEVRFRPLMRAVDREIGRLHALGPRGRTPA